MAAPSHVEASLREASRLLAGAAGAVALQLAGRRLMPQRLAGWAADARRAADLLDALRESLTEVGRT